MADLISRIRLEAEGGDQVAREIQKVQRAYKEAGAAKEGLSGGTPGSGYIGSSESTAQSMGWDAQARQRRDEHGRFIRENEERSSQQRSGGGLSGAQRMAQNFNQMSSGQTGAGMGGVFGALSAVPVVGQIAALIGTIVTGGALKALDVEAGMVNQLHGSGIGQQMGVGYLGARDMMIEGARKRGISGARFTGFSQGFTGVGGAMEDDADMRRFWDAQMWSMYTGVDASLAGRMSGQFSRLNLKNSTQEGIYGMGLGAFGQGEVDTFIQAVSSAIQEGTNRGIKESDLTSAWVEGQAGLIANLSAVGGLGPEAAVNLFQQASQGTASLRGGRGSLMNMYLASMGGDFLGNITRAEDDPAARIRGVTREAMGVGGGINSVSQHLLAQQMNITGSQAQALMEAVSEGLSGDALKKRVSEISGDLYAREITATKESRMFDVVQKGLADLTTGITELVGFGESIDQNFDRWLSGSVISPKVIGSAQIASQKKAVEALQLDPELVEEIRSLPNKQAIQKLWAETMQRHDLGGTEIERETGKIVSRAQDDLDFTEVELTAAILELNRLLHEMTSGAVHTQ